MGKLSNVIFYLDSWGPSYMIKKDYEVEHIPDIGETVVLQVESEYNFYKVEERVFDFADNLVHFRLSKSLRCYDLAI